MDSWSESPLPDGEILVRNRRNGKQMVLPVEIVNAMSFCTRFRTLDEHLDELVDGSEGEDSAEVAARRAGIRSVIQSLQEGGMTISAQEICDRLTAPPAVNPVTQKPILTVITWQRPEALARLLDSLLLRCDPEGIERCFVIDDSRDPESIRKNRDITLTAAQQAEIKLDYFGEAEARRLLDELVDALPQHEEAIRFLIDRDRWASHWTCGISRNYSQLLSVGHPLIVFDDDVICDVHEAPFARPGIDLANYPRQAEFFASQQEWPPTAAAGQRDPVARHMRCLGLTVPEALSILGVNRPEAAALHQGEAELADRLHASSRVLVTECGSLGDPGTGNNQWLTRLSAESRKRLLKDEKTFLTALKKRNSWLGRPRFTFSPASNMSQISGTDNRDFLPPYFPFNRVEDRLFGQTTSFIFPKSVSLDQPWGTPHLPMPERSWTQRSNDFTLTDRFPCDLLFLPQGLHQACPFDEPMDRLRYLAHHYLDLANCPDNELIQLFADDWHDKRSARLLNLHDNLRQSVDEPLIWREYLHKAMQQVVNSSLGKLTEENLEGSTPALAGNELLNFWKDSFRSYGQSLLAWPEIREAVRRKL